MKKLLGILMLPFVMAGCANTVEIEDKASYKCGNAIIEATFFDDDTMMVAMDGKEYVLDINDEASGDKYENMADKVVFWDKGDIYFELNGQGYPTCQKIVK